MRIKDCRRGGEGFFDRVRAEPVEHIQHGPRLIVDVGSSCATEGLLSNYRVGAPVIDVRAPGSATKCFLYLCNHLATLRGDNAGQSIRRSGITDAKGLIKHIIIVDADEGDGSGDLHHYGLVVRGFAEDYGRLNELALAAVIGPTGNDFVIRGNLCAVDKALTDFK